MANLIKNIIFESLVEKQIIELITDYKNHGIPLENINSGFCNLFAEDLYKKLQKKGVTAEILYDGDFCDDEETNLRNPEDYGSVVPKNYNLQKNCLPAHSWIYFNGKHYDCDVPRGVKNFFDLPVIKNYVKKSISVLNENDYWGEHSAPTKEDSPIYDLSGTYPDDIYEGDAVRMYGDHSPFYSDYEAISIIQSAKGKPNKKIKIYRAVPNLNYDIEKEIDFYNFAFSYLHKFNFLPSESKVDSKYHKVLEEIRQLWYEDFDRDKVIKFIHNKIDALSNGKSKSLKINDGDWVTISRRYAKNHGVDNLKGRYKILSKIVNAKELYTDGNSIFEWGYRI